MGFIAHVHGPSTGFVSAFGAGVLETTFRRPRAWVFRDRSALEQALHQALGLNSLLYELQILPAIDGGRVR